MTCAPPTRCDGPWMSIGKMKHGYCSSPGWRVIDGSSAVKPPTTSPGGAWRGAVPCVNDGPEGLEELHAARAAIATAAMVHGARIGVRSIALGGQSRDEPLAEQVRIPRPPRQQVA